jgi:hypothetical protein
MSRSSSSWDALPDEVVTALCANLGASADFAAARLACKSWARSVTRAVKTLSAKGEMPRRRPSGRPDWSLLRNLTSVESLAWEIGPEEPDRRYDATPLVYLTALKSLSITLENDLRLAFIFRVPMKEVVAGLEALTHITSLSLHSYNMRTLPRGLFRLTQLESLALPACKYVYSLVGLERLPRLTSLDLSECSADLTTLPPTIRSLRFHDTIDWDGGIRLHTIPPGVATSLTSLVITDSYVFDHRNQYTDFRTLATMTSLETLVMRDCRGFGRREVSALAGLQRLRTLDLSASRGWSLFGPQDDENADIGCLAGLASLTSLKLNGTAFVSFPEDLGALCRLSRLTGLTSLEVTGLCDDDDVSRETVEARRDEALAALSAALPNLTTLRV